MASIPAALEKSLFLVRSWELGMDVETYQLHHKNKQYVIAASQNTESYETQQCVFICRKH